MTDHDTMSRAVERIRTIADPVRIVLFGSAARGDMTARSDLDLLVVIHSGRHRRKTAQQIYRSLVDIGSAVDVVVVTEEDMERYQDHPGMIISEALKEGRNIYVA